MGDQAHSKAIFASPVGEKPRFLPFLGRHPSKIEFANSIFGNLSGLNDIGREVILLRSLRLEHALRVSASRPRRSPRAISRGKMATDVAILLLKKHSRDLRGRFFLNQGFFNGQLPGSDQVGYEAGSAHKTYAIPIPSSSTITTLVLLTATIFSLLPMPIYDNTNNQ